MSNYRVKTLPAPNGPKRYLVHQNFESSKTFSTVIGGRVLTEYIDVMYDDWIVPKTISMRGAKIRKSDAFVILGALDPRNQLPDESIIDEEDISGFMFGGGEDGLGHFVIK